MDLREEKCEVTLNTSIIKNNNKEKDGEINGTEKNDGKSSINNTTNNEANNNEIEDDMLSTVQQIQQNFLAGAPPTLVAFNSCIPLYPGYSTGSNFPSSNQMLFPNNSSGGKEINGNSINGTSKSNKEMSKYNQLLMVIEEMGKEVRPTYSGSKTSSERLKRGITQCRILLRECLHENDRNNNQRN